MPTPTYTWLPPTGPRFGRSRTWDDDGAFPPVGNQCATDACLSWALGYHALTWMLKRQDPGRRVSKRKHQISPSWMHTFMAQGDPDGAGGGLGVAACVLLHQGAPSVAAFPPTCDPSAVPTIAAKREARRAKRAWKRDHLAFVRFRTGTPEQNHLDLQAALLHLGAQGPVVLQVSVGPALLSSTGLDGDEVTLQLDEANHRAAHALVAVGYDVGRVNRDGSTGSLRVLNSYGPAWGDGGRAWVPFDVVDSWVRHQYLRDAGAFTFGSRTVRAAWIEEGCKKPTRVWRFRHALAPSPPAPRLGCEEGPAARDCTRCAALGHMSHQLSFPRATNGELLPIEFLGPRHSDPQLDIEADILTGGDGLTPGTWAALLPARHVEDPPDTRPRWFRLEPTLLATLKLTPSATVVIRVVRRRHSILSSQLLRLRAAD